MAAAASSADDGASSLRLEWHDHGAQMTSLTRDLCGQSELTDVLLSCRGGVTFHAHKLVLAGASTHFRSMFQQLDPWRQPVIFLNDVRPSELEYLLQFIYQGEVSIPDSDLQSLLKVAKNLGIVGLHGIGGSSHAQSSSGRYASTPSSYRQAPRNASGSGQKRKLPWSKLAPAENPKRATRSSVGRPSTSKEPHPDDDFSGDQDDYPEPDAVSLHSNDPLDESIHNEEGEEGGDLGDDSASVNVKSEFIEEPYQIVATNYLDEAGDKKDCEELIEGQEKAKSKVKKEIKTEDEEPFFGDQVISIIKYPSGCKGGGGEEKIALNGNLYGRQKVLPNKIRWRCTTKGCGGYVWTGPNFLETGLGSEMSMHNHPPDENRVRKYILMSSIYEQMKDVEPKARGPLAERLVSTMSEEDRKLLPKKDSLRRLVRRKNMDAGSNTLVGHVDPAEDNLDEKDPMMMSSSP